MADGPLDNAGRGKLRAFYDWIAGTGPAAGRSTPPAGASRGDGTPPARLGHYTIERTIGQGGMGIVYAARDERLGRPVALKAMTRLADDETARRRFWREARAAASVNHPNICQVYEIGEDTGELFIAMELLEGASLADVLRRGPMSVPETVSAGLGMLAALAAMHARGIVHRDLKPSNVFVTPHGVKLLDFGLARPAAGGAEHAPPDLTRTGVLMGTPRYMAPEQAMGEDVDARADLFAAGAILFEMLAGRPAFTGRTAIEILHAAVYGQPPALAGSHAVAAVDRVIRRALAKKPSDRPESADAMAAELRAIGGADPDDTAALARPLTRVVVLPFRALRPDADTDFLAFSLPDAITTSLSGIASLVVRSSATAARFAGDVPDLKTIAAEADVDRVVAGTLLRSGEEIRVTAQLLEAPAGTVLTSHTVQSPLGDLFRLQDDIARQMVKALALPLATGTGPSPGATPSPAADAPRSARAYECYLRANELARTIDGVPQAREMYQRAVELDPGFAPAWARLGRSHRVMGKYIQETPGSEALAEQALRHALELNPRLTIAHKFLANLEADIGQAERAVVRLLGEATRHGNDPELFAGLVHACRYCGLFDESIAAHAEASRLDPNVITGVEQTLLMTRDVDRLLAFRRPGADPAADSVIRVIGLGLAGRRDEALAGLIRLSATPRLQAFEEWARYLMAWLERRVDEMLADYKHLNTLKVLDDPEAVFQRAWLLCDAGEHARGLPQLQRAVAGGYLVAPTLATAPQFDALRGDPAFESTLAAAEAGRVRALAAFRDAGGDRLLGR